MIDFDKPVQTLYGEPVRIIETNVAGARYPIVGLVATGGGERLYRYDRQGRVSLGRGPRSPRPHSLDLINVPEKHTLWLNINRVSGNRAAVGGYYSSREEADAWAIGVARIACIPITVTEGEGLEDV